jgi:hypothetical protein
MDGHGSNVERTEEAIRKLEGGAIKGTILLREKLLEKMNRA